MATAAIALGSNLAPERNIPEAFHKIAARPELTLIARSAVYSTASVGSDGAPDGHPPFHNGMVLVETLSGPLRLRRILRAIEAELGRRRTSDRYAPRPIDLDIVFYDNVVVRTESVTIPDPDALRLAHLVVPLADVAPDWRPPGSSITAARVAAGHELTPVEIRE